MPRRPDVNKRGCEDYKLYKIWEPGLCHWCAESNCDDRRMLPIPGLKKITNRNKRFYKIKEGS